MRPYVGVHKIQPRDRGQILEPLEQENDVSAGRPELIIAGMWVR